MISVSPARAAAFDILLRIEEQDAYASELLHAAHYKKLSSADRGLMTELVMGVLRWRSVLDGTISQASSQKIQRLDREVLTALRMAVYQMRWLERIPARAAIHESVELVKRAHKRSAAPFVNAVLRKSDVKPRPPSTSEAGSPKDRAQAWRFAERTCFAVCSSRMACRAMDQGVRHREHSPNLSARSGDSTNDHSPACSRCRKATARKRDSIIAGFAAAVGAPHGIGRCHPDADSRRGPDQDSGRSLAISCNPRGNRLEDSRLLRCSWRQDLDIG